MGVKITVKKRIVVNGKEYGGPEELPPDLRSAYERAVARGGVAPGKVTFNGQVYDGIETMPPEVRELFDDALAAARAAPGLSVSVEKDGPRASPIRFGSAADDGSAPITPAGSPGLRWILALLGLGFLLFLFWMVTRAAK